MKQLCAHPQQFSNAPTNIKPQVQEGIDNRPPPLEDAPVCKSTAWPDAGKISENLFEERKDWLLPPNYLNNDNKDMTGITSPKPPIKEEPKIEEQSFTSLRTDKCGWGPNCPLCKNQEKKRRLGWQLPKTTARANTAPTRDSDAPSKVLPNPKLPETPELSEIQTGNIRWLISKSVKYLQAVGSRDGKT